MVIAANAITIGLETDVRVGQHDGRIYLLWFFLEVMFCIIFMIELALRLILKPTKAYCDHIVRKYGGSRVSRPEVGAWGDRLTGRSVVQR